MFDVSKSILRTSWEFVPPWEFTGNVEGILGKGCYCAHAQNEASQTTEYEVTKRRGIEKMLLAIHETLKQTIGVWVRFFP